MTGSDSETTVKQKAIVWESIQSWITYIQTHGLSVINLTDLRDVEQTLSEGVDVGIPRA